MEMTAKQWILPRFDRVDTKSSPTLLTRCHEDEWKVFEVRWCLVAYLQNVHNDHVVWSSTIDNHLVDVHRPCLEGWLWRQCVMLVSPRLWRTFQPPSCESCLAAFEAAVDVLSDVHVHPSGKKSVVSHMSS